MILDRVPTSDEIERLASIIKRVTPEVQVDFEYGWQGGRSHDFKLGLLAGLTAAQAMIATKRKHQVAYYIVLVANKILYSS